MLGDQRAQLVDIHNILGALLVGAAKHKLELVGGHSDGLEDSSYGTSVEFGTVLDKFNRGFEVVEESVDVGEEHRDIAAGSEELGDFDGRDEVAAVRTTSGGGTWRGEG